MIPEVLDNLNKLVDKYRSHIKGAGVERKTLERLDSDILAAVRPWLIEQARNS